MHLNEHTTEMMAQDKVEVVSHYKQGDVWKENTNFDLTKTDGEIYTWVLKDVPEAEANRGIFSVLRLVQQSMDLNKMQQKT